MLVIGIIYPRSSEKVDLSYLITRFCTLRLGETDALYYKRMLNFLGQTLRETFRKHNLWQDLWWHLQDPEVML